MKSAKIVDVLTMQGQNKVGKFSQITQELGNQDINILGFTGIAENGNELTSLLVEQPEQAQSLLSKKGVDAQLEEAVVVETPNRPGVAGQLTDPLQKEKVNLNKAFPFVVEDGKKSGLVLQTSDPKTTKSLLEQHAKQKVQK